MNVTENFYTPMLIAHHTDQFKIANQPRCPSVNDWKENVECVHCRIVLSHKK